MAAWVCVTPPKSGSRAEAPLMSAARFVTFTTVVRSLRLSQLSCAIFSILSTPHSNVLSAGVAPGASQPEQEAAHEGAAAAAGAVAA